MKLHVEISDEHVVEIDVPPGSPQPHGLDLRYEVATVEELAARVDELGGIEDFYLSEKQPSAMRFAVPIRCDGERAGNATLFVRIKEVSVPEPAPGPLAGLIAEQKLRRAERERSEAIS